MLAALLLTLPLLMAADGGKSIPGRTLCGLCLPCTCELDCVSLDIDCGCCPGGSKDPIVVDFLYADSTVLGTATIPGPWCMPCGCGSYEAMLDKPVDPAAVKYVRITKPGDDDLYLDWFKLSASYPKNCCKTKWATLFKCCVPVKLGQGEGADQAIVLM
jgi:hypothetical protein